MRHTFSKCYSNIDHGNVNVDDDDNDDDENMRRKFEGNVVVEQRKEWGIVRILMPKQ